MNKKILGMILITVFMGVPSFAMANPCVLGDPDYNPLDTTCSMAGSGGAIGSGATDSYSYLYCMGDFLVTGKQPPKISPAYTTLEECNRAQPSTAPPSPYYNVGSCTKGGAKPYTLCDNTLPGSLTGRPAGDLTSTSVSTPLANPIKYRTFSSFVSGVTATAVEILMPFVVLAFIWSGFLFVRAQGKDEALTEAKTAIKWSIVGAFILMGAYGFSQIICTTVVSISGEPTNSCQ